MDDERYVGLAIENSKKSMREGNFPAGAVVVRDGEVLASAVSSVYPGLFHADSKAVSQAFEAAGPLKGATLYVSMESCLMCASVAYWGGIRRVVYAVRKSEVSGNYYETHQNTSAVLQSYNEPIETVHFSALEEEALKIVREWEEKNPVSV